MNFFITELYLKESTPITANVDVTDLLPWIETSAKLWIQPILGTYFFNDLLTKYNNQTLNSDEVALVQYIQPAIAWRSAADCVVGLSYQLKNKGIQIQNGENSSAASFEEVKFNIKHYEQKAQNFEQLLINYLKLNKDLYPEFTSDLNKDSLCKPYGGDNINTTITII